MGKWDSYNDEDKGVEHSKKLFPAIELLNNPQELAEIILQRLRSTGQSAYTFEVKLLLINFVTRLVGNHELLILPLYPFLQKYLGGHQRDVTAILAYTVQACHEYVPPDEINGLLKTIAHNFITERCTGEQMAVGINAVRSICARVPSVLADDNNTEDLEGISARTFMDMEAFARDLAGYAKHKDRSVMIAGKSWVNFIREVHPSLLQGKDRGTVGSALYKHGEKPLRYGEQMVSHGVEGADLLLEYEAKKMAARKMAAEGSENELEEESRNDDEYIENSSDHENNDYTSDDGEENKMKFDDNESGDDISVDAPELVLVDEKTSIDLNKMSEKEKKELKMKTSSTRIFTASDFEKMRKLVARKKELQRDPRAAARLKRSIAKSGTDFEELSGDESDDLSEDDGGVRISGAVCPEDIMAMAKKKRLNKAERLEKVIEGRERFVSKVRQYEVLFNYIGTEIFIFFLIATSGRVNKYREKAQKEFCHVSIFL